MTSRPPKNSHSWDVFISYETTTGLDFARQVKAALARAQLSAFLAFIDIPKGTNDLEYRLNALRASRYVVVILTGLALFSEEVKRELSIAGEHSKTIIPCKKRELGWDEISVMPLIGRRQGIEFESKEELADKVVTEILGIEREQKSKRKVLAEDINAKSSQQAPAPSLGAPSAFIPLPHTPSPPFIGRVQQKTLLTEWLRESTSPMFVIESFPGQGKTELAWNWIQEEVLKKEPVQVMWWSFYWRRTFDGFVNDALKFLKGSEARDAPLSDRVDLLVEILQQRRVLIVLDGVERLLNNYTVLRGPYQGEEVREDVRGDFRACTELEAGRLLRHMASSALRSKTLMTTRLLPQELDGIVNKECHLQLPGLDPLDAVRLVRMLRVKGTDHEIRLACEHAGFHPLMLRALAGLIINDPELRGDVRKLSLVPQLTIEQLRGIPEAEKLVRILKTVFERLPKEELTLLCRLAAFLDGFGFEAALALREPREKEAGFKERLRRLIERGLLLYNPTNARYDLHPLIRQYAYDRLTDRESTHSRLSEYFAKVQKPTARRSLDDLLPVVDLYYHVLRSGRLAEALGILEGRLLLPLYFQLSAYTTYAELFQSFLPSPRAVDMSMSNQADQAWLYNEIANVYDVFGNPQQALDFYERAVDIYHRIADVRNEAVCLINLGHMRRQIGELKQAEGDLRNAASLCAENNDRLVGFVADQELGHVLIYEGRFTEASRHLNMALKWCLQCQSASYRFSKKKGPTRLCSPCVGYATVQPHKRLAWRQSESLLRMYLAVLHLFQDEYEPALLQAKHALRLAGRDGNLWHVMYANSLCGSALMAMRQFAEAEERISHSAELCRRAHNLEFEPRVLLPFARLHAAKGRYSDALATAQEALEIADRCGYRLDQADIHLFIAEIAMKQGDLTRAQTEAEEAAKYASCGYRPTLDKTKTITGSVHR